MHNNTCTALAARLSFNFFQTQPFRPDADSLPTFLKDHGVLLTMCLSSVSCALLPGEDHISASWITQETGPAVIPTQLGVGLILDPTQVNIDCIYPTDGGTMGREKKGCGRHVLQSESVAVREEIQWQMKLYKDFNFGANTAWTDIDCGDLLGYLFREGAMLWDCPSDTPPPDGTAASWSPCVLDPSRWTFHSYLQRAKDSYEKFLGHSICTMSEHSSDGYPRNYLLFNGIDSWNASQWHEMAMIQSSLIRVTPARSPVWNEIVISKNNDQQELRHLVQAVVYTDLDDFEDEDMVWQARKLAHEQAKLLGNKPVFRVTTLTPDERNPLFVCDDEYSSSVLQPHYGDAAGKAKLELPPRVQKDETVPFPPKVSGVLSTANPRLQQRQLRGAPKQARNSLDPMAAATWDDVDMSSQRLMTKILGRGENDDACTALAETLVSNFMNTGPFNPQVQTLASYLENHGILVSMCMSPFTCLYPRPDKFILASWVTKDTGITAVAPNEVGVGLILDPTVVTIRCIYPTSAGVYQREGDGCGPLPLDPAFGSVAKQSRARQAFQEHLRQYKNFNFGHDTVWADLECSDFFGKIREHQALGWKCGSGNDDAEKEPTPWSSCVDDPSLWSIHSTAQELKEEYENIMNQTVCTLKNMEVPPPNYLLHMDHQSLHSSQWQEMISVQKSLKSLSSPLETEVWNEIVIARDQELSNLVKAVVYAQDDDDEETSVQAKKLAHQQAALLGNKPVLKVTILDPSEDERKPVVVCDDDKSLFTLETKGAGNGQISPKKKFSHFQFKGTLGRFASFAKSNIHDRLFVSRETLSNDE